MRHHPASPARQPLLWVALAAALAGFACHRADTPATPVTSTSANGTSTAPSPNDAARRDEAMVRVIQVSPAGALLDLFAGDLVLFDRLSYKAVTPYRAVDGQRYAFQLRPAGQPKAAPLSSNTEGLKRGGFYTAITMPGNGDTTRLRVVADPLDAPPAGQARVRLVNAGVDAGAVGLLGPGSTTLLLAGVEPQAVSDYRDVAPSAGGLQIVGRDGQVLATVGARVDAGHLYTIVLAGAAQREPRFEALVVADGLVP